MSAHKDEGANTYHFEPPKIDLFHWGLSRPAELYEAPRSIQAGDNLTSTLLKQ